MTKPIQSVKTTIRFEINCFLVKGTSDNQKQLVLLLTYAHDDKAAGNFSVSSIDSDTLIIEHESGKQKFFREYLKNKKFEYREG